MPNANDAAAGIFVKIERAKKHLYDLEQLIQEFFTSNPYRIEIHDEASTGDRVFKVRTPHSPPLEWSAIVGDIVHNLRAALDLLICELVRAEGNRVTDTTGFPIGKGAKQFKSGYLQKVSGVSKEAIQLIKAAKPYKGGNEPLWWLHRLDIADKHRILITVGSAYENFIVDFGAMFRESHAASLSVDPSEIPSMPIAINPADRQWPLKDGAEVYRVMPAARDAHKDEDIHFTFGIAFGEGEVVQGEPLTPSLHQLVASVEEVVGSLVPLLCKVKQR